MAAFEGVPVAGAEALAAAVTRAVEVLEAGGLLAHPTATVYGIGGAPRSDVDLRASRLKGRAADGHRVLRIASDVDVLRQAFPDLRWSEAACRLADRFWPGPLTMILPGDSGATLAVRVEAHPVTRTVLTEWGRPIGSTSLNAAGAPPATTVGQARPCLDAMPAEPVSILLLEAGDLAGAPPSTLVSVAGDGVAIVRQGAIGEEEVWRCLL